MVPETNNWNDDRLDELSRRVDEGFKQMNARLDQAATKEDLLSIHARLDQAATKEDLLSIHARTDRMATKEDVLATRDDLRFLSSRFDKLQNTLLVVGGGLMGTVIASTAALITALT